MRYLVIIMAIKYVNMGLSNKGILSFSIFKLSQMIQCPRFFTTKCNSMSGATLVYIFKVSFQRSFVQKIDIWNVFVNLIYTKLPLKKNIPTLMCDQYSIELKWE